MRFGRLSILLQKIPNNITPLTELCTISVCLSTMLTLSTLWAPRHCLRVSAAAAPARHERLGGRFQSDPAPFKGTPGKRSLASGTPSWVRLYRLIQNHRIGTGNGVFLLWICSLYIYIYIYVYVYNV